MKFINQACALIDLPLPESLVNGTKVPPLEETHIAATFVIFVQLIVLAFSWLMQRLEKLVWNILVCDLSFEVGSSRILLFVQPNF